MTDKFADLMDTFETKEEWEGFIDSTLGVPLSSNPYSTNTLTEVGRLCYNNWEMGWKRRFHNDDGL